MNMNEFTWMIAKKAFDLLNWKFNVLKYFSQPCEMKSWINYNIQSIIIFNQYIICVLILQYSLIIVLRMNQMEFMMSFKFNYGGKLLKTNKIFGIQMEDSVIVNIEHVWTTLSWAWFCFFPLGCWNCILFIFFIFFLFFFHIFYFIFLYFILFLYFFIFLFYSLFIRNFSTLQILQYFSILELFAKYKWIRKIFM